MPVPGALNAAEREGGRPGSRCLGKTGKVLFPRRLWAGLADGTVTVAFRRWQRPSVRQGGTLQSPGGLLSIDELAAIDVDDITDEDARAAGYRHPAEVVDDLRPAGTLYRIRFSRLGDDPRIALRHDVRPDDAVLTAVRRLPWASVVLRLIGERPATVSTVLAAEAGMERLAFKQRVRRLKALGLTESLEVGYRLSPRGQAVLDQLDCGPDEPER